QRNFNGDPKGRLAVEKDRGHPGMVKLFVERNWHIVDAVKEVSEETGKTQAQIALNWVISRPGITSTIIGATKMAQLNDNLAAVDFELPGEALEQLEVASRLDSTIHPYIFFTEEMQARVHGGTTVRAWVKQT